MKDTNAEVLLIGQNEILVQMTARMLRRNGYTVWPAVGLQQAQQILMQRTPQLILMDGTLPDADGAAACRHFRSQNLPVKILITSDNEEDEIRTLQAGADDFIKKPYRVEVLEARMKRLCQMQ